MKRLISLLLTAALLLTLTACSPGVKKAPFQPSLTNQLLETDAFSEPLDPLEADLVFLLYGLDEAGLVREQLIAASAYRSSGATCEELALLTFADETAAQSAVNALDSYIAGQIQTNKDYRPAEISKLENVLLERRGATILLMVANDYEAAYELLAP